MELWDQWIDKLRKSRKWVGILLRHRTVKRPQRTLSGVTDVCKAHHYTYLSPDICCLQAHVAQARLPEALCLASLSNTLCPTSFPKRLSSPMSPTSTLNYPSQFSATSEGVVGGIWYKYIAMKANWAGKKLKLCWLENWGMWVKWVNLRSEFVVMLSVPHVLTWWHLI